MDTFNLITTLPLRKKIQVYLEFYLYQNAPHPKVKHTYCMYIFVEFAVWFFLQTPHKNPTKIIKPVVEFISTKRTL